MKKIVILAALLLIGTSAYAQVEWGFKGGLNMAHLTKSEFNTKTSLHAGMFVEFGLNDRFAIQPELIYSREGAYVKKNSISTYAKMNYMNVPVLFKLYIIKNKLSFETGPQVGFNINAKYKTKQFHETAEKGTIEDIEPVNVSIPVGFTWKAINHLDFSFRYNIGVTKVSKEPLSKSRSGVAQVSVGLRF